MTASGPIGAALFIKTKVKLLLLSLLLPNLRRIPDVGRGARESTSSPLRESSVRVTLGLTDGIVSESHWRVVYEP